MKHKILIGMLLLSLILLSGCIDVAKTGSAYFDIPCETSCDDCERQEACNKICEESGIRIIDYQHNNEVFFKEGKFICKCF